MLYITVYVKLCFNIVWYVSRNCASMTVFWCLNESVVVAQVSGVRSPSLHPILQHLCHLCKMILQKQSKSINHPWSCHFKKSNDNTETLCNSLVTPSCPSQPSGCLDSICRWKDYIIPAFTQLVAVTPSAGPKFVWKWSKSSMITTQ